jgi:ribosomal protein S18 acetylase RimI-like enzyme
VIEPEIRGMGLGKALLVLSINRQLVFDSTIIEVGLDVTLSNPAIKLYESIGFEKVSDWSLYTWKK